MRFLLHRVEFKVAIGLLLPAAAAQAEPCTDQDSLTVRNAHVLAYHAGEAAVMLFGGADERQVHGDLWSWNGLEWDCIAATGPPPRTFPALAYDEHHDRLILFGGNRVLFGTERDTATFLDDLWSWTADDSWSRIDVETPTARAEASTAYDRHRKRIVLFGGYRIEDGETVRLGDTWEWDGASWELVGTVSPPQRNGTAMVYDPVRRRTILFGGSGVPGGTWEWDGREWTQSPTPEVEGRFNTAMAYNESEQVVIRFGGWTGNDRIGDTWTYDGVRWTRLEIEGPAARNHASAAYDRRRDVIVLFGGHDGNRVFGDTWELDGSEWLPVGETRPRRRVDNGH